MPTSSKALCVRQHGNEHRHVDAGDHFTVCVIMRDAAGGVEGRTAPQVNQQQETLRRIEFGSSGADFARQHFAVLSGDEIHTAHVFLCADDHLRRGQQGLGSMTVCGDYNRDCHV